MKKKAAKKSGGRKKVEDPKEPVTVWIEKSIIKALGGLDNTKTIARAGVKVSYQKQVDIENNDE